MLRTFGGLGKAYVQEISGVLLVGPERGGGGFRGLGHTGLQGLEFEVVKVGQAPTKHNLVLYPAVRGRLVGSTVRRLSEHASA